MAALEPRIRAIVDELIDAAPGTFDGVEVLGEPMPVAVIAELIGVPESDRPTFRAWSAAIMSGYAEERDAATLAFAAYVDELADERLLRPRGDLLSGLAALDELARDDLVAMVQLLLIAGQETAVYTIVNGLRALLGDPGQWRALCEDPGLAAAAVEEVLRFDGPVEIAPPRFALREVHLGGGTVPAGERIGLSLLGANRDPGVFAAPDRFDLRRTDAGHQLGFGHGIHYCLGAGLGRLEARIVFRRLAERVPGLQLAQDPGGGWIAPHSGQLPLAIQGSRSSARPM